MFRDLGIAFVAAQIGIFVILMFETGSRMLPLVIMLAIPLTMIGIMPGFWLLNVLVDRPVGGYPNPVFLTATAMIGMIALSGIVVRNSVVLIDFIHHGQAEGLSLGEAVIRSVAVRTRPILATAGTDPAGQLGDHARPDLLGPGLGDHLRHLHLDAVHALGDSGRLLAALRQAGRYNLNGVGVKPTKMKARVSQPRTILAVPSGTSSFAVGGWIGPITNNSRTIRIHIG